MTGLLGMKAPVTPAQGPLPTPPNPADPTVRAAQNEALLAGRQAAGRASTMITGGRGVAAPPVTSKKSILGG